MPYRFLEDVATADIAFEAEGKTLEELFAAAAQATTNVMVSDLAQLEEREVKEIREQAEQIDLLLFAFLQEIVYYKDAELLLFRRYDVEIVQKDARFELEAWAYGEKLDSRKHDLIVDVKAVTLHQFEVKETGEGWKARVILDI